MENVPNWVSSEDHLPGKHGMYLVWVHEPTRMEKDDWMADYNSGYVDLLHYDADQGIWQNEPYEAYNAHLEFVDTEHCYYISHWMEKPDGPEGA